MNFYPCRRVGYWWSEKKSRKLSAEKLADVCRISGLELVKLDLDQSFEEQGPFVAIVHKLSDVMVKARNGEPQSIAICESFQEYVKSHPQMAVIDSLQNIDKLLGRYDQYKAIDECEICAKGDIFIPAFVELLTMDVSENLLKIKSAGVDFPLVCKPSMAHGSTRSHQMSLIFNEEGLKDITPPCVVQKFVNHNAVLYKLFVVGNEYFVIERPSLKNFYACDEKNIYFDSNEISKPNSVSELTELDATEPFTPTIWPEKEKLDTIVQVLHKYLGLNLIGIDVVIDNKTGHYAIIDMNVFPGYWEADNFYHLLTNLILKEIHLSQSSESKEPYVPHLIDHLSTPMLKTTKKSTLDSTEVFQFSEAFPKQIDHSQECSCFLPSTGACCNMDHASSTVQTCGMDHSKCANSGGKAFNRQSDGQEDSGIETSDSCDEKKHKVCHRTLRHHHSKLQCHTCSSLKESGEKYACM